MALARSRRLGLNYSCDFKAEGEPGSRSAGREIKAGIFAQTGATGNENPDSVVQSPLLRDEWAWPTIYIKIF